MDSPDTARTQTEARLASRLVSALRKRWGPLTVAAAVAFVIATGGLWAVVRFTAPPTLAGAVLTPPAPAYDFRLTDQRGHAVALSDLQGKAVALTFLYARCPDACPLIAELMRATYEQLGDAAGRTAFVAVSVDPRGDTPEAIRTFLKVHRVEDVLTYLHGSSAQLRPVWAHYGVGAQEVIPEAVGAPQPTPPLVGHTGAVYIIDPQERIRAFLDGNFEPRDLARDLQLLARTAR